MKTASPKVQSRATNFPAASHPVPEAMRVPLFDLTRQYAEVQQEIHEGLQAVFHSQRFILGPEVQNFEREVAAYLGVRHVVAVASGSDALLLALLALGVGPGDAVVTTPLSFFATVGACVRLGSRPLFVDIDPDTYELGAGALEEFLREKCRSGANGLREKRTGARVRAILPVHLYGQCADMTRILSLARRYRVLVVEDAAQAFGATWNGRKAGTWGTIGCYSFYPTKNLGAWGDAGMLTTDRGSLARVIRELRVHGSLRREYVHDRLGFNSRMDALQAAVLRVKLRHVDRWLGQRREAAGRYDRLFRDAGFGQARLRQGSGGQAARGRNQPLGGGDDHRPVQVPAVDRGGTHTYHQYVIRVKRREALRAHLAEKGIETRVYYPVSLHLQPCLRGFGYRRGQFPEAERSCREILALPFYPEISEEAQAYVVHHIHGFYSQL